MRPRILVLKATEVWAMDPWSVRIEDLFGEVAEVRPKVHSAL